ncbi:putative ammonium transporter 1 isoform X1 [Haliotis rufescens]|uniref:putative ammonium transporter 1 isoform X1 n=2 Tax=Haliotis rufescens TaxID=6454 RepID=UPI00201EF256|nr:putative ammonium transporter 1 isoform X1 [Haliotis rufescens]
MAVVNVTWEQYTSLQKGLDDLKINLDQFFLIVMGMVVYLMQCGFAFLEAGAVRSKNSTNILIKNLMDSFVAGIAYWTIGYPLAYGAGNSFIGYSYWASKALPDTEFASFFFQYVFAATAATIVSGAMAERCEFLAYFIYSFFITGFVYPVVTHWVWSPAGWLAVGATYDNGTITAVYQDFAGSGVVHILGGTAAFCGALLLGPRLGRFHRDKRGPIDLRGHSVPLAALGGFILLFGFLAFNGGSALNISGEGSGAVISLSVVNTIISGSMSAFVSLFIHKTGYFGTRHWSLLNTLNGALTGMVAACAGCNVFSPWGALVVGFFAGISYKMWSSLVGRIKVDDPLDAVAVHFGGGLWGVISVAFLKKDEGIVFAWDKKSGLNLAWQLAGVTAITAWTATLCLVMFGILRLLGKLRVDEAVERKGLDIHKHGEPAYPMESYGHGWVERILKVLEDGRLSEIKQVVPGIDNDGYKYEENHSVGFDSPEVEVMNKGRIKRTEHPLPVVQSGNTVTTPM